MTDRRRHWLAAALLFALVFVAFFPALRGQFIWDDDHYVTENLSLRSFSGLSDIWLGLLTAGAQGYRTLVAPQYYPATFTSFWLESRVFGWTHPLPFHLVNVLLHACSAWMLWTILRRLAVPGAWLIAAVWAVHPVQVESVAWITERKNVLSGFFYLASLLLYLRYCGLIAGPSENSAAPSRVYLFAALLFLAALLSKSVTGSLPAVVLLLIWWKRGRIARRDIIPLLPFFALAIAMGAVTSYMERNVVGARGPEFAFTFAQRLIIAGRAVWFYAGKLLWPHPLIFIYPRWDLTSPDARWQLVMFPAALCVALVLFLFRSRIGRGPAVAGLFFVGTLFPALGFVNVYPMRYSFVADHFQYLASIGVIALVIGGLARVRVKTPLVRCAFAAALLVPLVWLTFKQSRVYSSPRVLWETVLARNPSAWMAHNNLGGLLMDTDRAAAAMHFRKTLELKPNHAEAMMNLGRIEEESGHIDDAIALYRRAIDAHPELAEPHYNLARALTKLHDTSGAIAEYWRTIDLDPNHVYARVNLGVLLADDGKFDQAINQYQAALSLDPDSIPARMNLANALEATGRLDQAMLQFGDLLHRQPNNPELPNRVGILLARTGRLDAGIAMFRQALRINPNYAPAANNLAHAMQQRQGGGGGATRPS